MSEEKLPTIPPAIDPEVLDSIEVQNAKGEILSRVKYLEMEAMYQSVMVGADTIRPGTFLWDGRYPSVSESVHETWPCNDCGLPCLKGDDLCGPCYEKKRRDEYEEAMHPEHRCPPRE